MSNVPSPEGTLGKERHSFDLELTGLPKALLKRGTTAKDVIAWFKDPANGYAERLATAGDVGQFVAYPNRFSKSFKKRLHEGKSFITILGDEGMISSVLANGDSYSITRDSLKYFDMKLRSFRNEDDFLPIQIVLRR